MIARSIFLTTCVNPPPIPFSTISIISLSVNSSNFTLVHSNMASNVKPAVETKYEGSKSYLFRHKDLKFSKTSLNCPTSERTYKS